MTIVDAEIFGSDVMIEYADGSREEIAMGVYERKNSDGRTVTLRAATDEDFARLSDLAGTGRSIDNAMLELGGGDIIQIDGVTLGQRRGDGFIL